ncbi:hypothetical protein KSE_41340 [Kitasatospora setae KM-6054]|uniref:Uncharacterized protein n=1 Tax=Kitasatospora setae (strain ATCC 33774 / DSM 43861 / JCM 3304 / KCC A-0304 / NBRC 14216 / KM-6054) TaxID=452652 RepID=E4NEY5_KITSK|nr:hypothetical protein KSE_41340 [Kitasatospora setae KM-6054]
MKPALPLLRRTVAARPPIPSRRTPDRHRNTAPVRITRNLIRGPRRICLRLPI